MKYASSTRSDPNHVDGYALTGPVYAGADAGAYTLPADVEDARRALAIAEAIPDPPTVDVDAARDELVDGIIRAAERGGKVPTTAAAVVKAIAASTEADEQRTALGEAVRRCGRRRDSLVLGGADEIIGSHLAPSHDEAVASAEAAVAAIREAGADPAEALAASEILVSAELRPHRLALDAARRRYEAVHAARAVLVRATGGAPMAPQNIFSWARNGHELPRRSPMADAPAQPADPLAHFVWRITGPPQLWCPTTTTQDARYEEVFAEGLEAQSNARAASVGGVFVG